MEAARGSLEETAQAIVRTTGQKIGKRQLEQLAGLAAVDFEAFYAYRLPPEGEPGDLVVMSCDGKDIVMRPGALRPPTAAAAAKATPKLKTRLSKGEKRNRKQMAEVGAVYDATPAARTVADIIAANDVEPGTAQPGPTARHKWLVAWGHGEDPDLDPNLTVAATHQPRRAAVAPDQPIDTPMRPGCRMTTVKTMLTTEKDYRGDTTVVDLVDEVVAAEITGLRSDELTARLSPIMIELDGRMRFSRLACEAVGLARRRPGGPPGYWLSMGQAAEVLGVSRQAVYKMPLPLATTAGGHRVVRAHDVQVRANVRAFHRKHPKADHR